MKLKFHWDTGEVEWVNPGLCFIEGDEESDDTPPADDDTPPADNDTPPADDETPPAKWYGDLDEDLAKQADRFTDLPSMVRSMADLRKRESQVRVPGENATDEEIAAYRTAIGVPDAETPYEWTDPEGLEITDQITADRAAADEVFREAGISASQGKVIGEFFAKWQENQMAAVVAADTAYADSTEADLKSDWGEQYDANKTAADTGLKAVAERAGVPLEELTHIEMKSGRYLMDHPFMARMFAAIGKEMSSGTLDNLGSITEGERETIDNQIAELQTRMKEASDRGDHKTANKLYADEQALIAKRDGNRLITA